jgi:hypothetical protein
LGVENLLLVIEREGERVGLGCPSRLRRNKLHFTGGF